CMAKKDYKKLAQTIYEVVGKDGNIVNVQHCMTRLRLTLNNEGLVSDDEVKGIEGVTGVMHAGGQYQIIIGTDVIDVYNEFMKLGNFEGGTVDVAEKGDVKKDWKYYGGLVLNYITGSMAPALPVLIASGMCQAAVTILGLIGVLDTTSPTYTVLYQLAYAGFFYLPVFIGYNAAKKLDMQPLVGGMLGGALIIPTVMGVEGLSIFGLGINPGVSYTASVFPILLTMPFAKLVDMLVNKILPQQLKIVLRDAIVVFIMAPIMVLWLAPAGGAIGNGIIAGVNALNNISPILAAAVCGTILPVLICCGMHTALIPIMITICGTVGYDSTFINCFLAANFTCLGAALGVFLKAKKSGLKKVALSSTITALTGICEPAFFGVLIPLKKPLVANCIASGIIAIICSFLPMGAVMPAALSFMTLPVYANPVLPSSLMLAYIMGVVGIIVGAVCVYVIGFDESKFD
ncbi:MAG: PTS transporter subunit EIIC, partial [Holdemanella sp.]|nr:PTS transporter subunit EIIC [Holdemanella sp.]